MNELTTYQGDNLPANVQFDPVVAVGDGLRHGLGQDAEPSVAMVNGLLALAPKSVVTTILRSGVFQDPAVVRWVVSLLMSEGDPVAGDADAEREIAHIQHIMKTDRRRYNNDERMQARYRTLIASR